MVELKPMTKEDIHWIREQRNRPELMRYFRQNKPLTEREQELWWRGIDRSRIRLFVVIEGRRRIGYVGFNPFNAYARMAEFGIFIIPEEQNKGYGQEALEKLLRYGFDECHLSTIYSDVIDYPGEHRFDFYKKFGFVEFPKEHQRIRYRKGSEMVPAIKFYMIRDMWIKRQINGNSDEKANLLEPVGNVATLAPVVVKVKRKPGRPKKVHPL